MLDEERHSVLAVVEAVDLLRDLMPSVNSVVHINRGLTRNFKTFRKVFIYYLKLIYSMQIR